MASAQVSLATTGTLLAGPAAIDGVGLVGGDLAGALAAGDAEIAASIDAAVNVFTGGLVAGPATLGGWAFRRMQGTVALDAELTVSWVGTTRFVSLVERGEAELSVAAKITLRTLAS
ncbi:hypothetical protein [Rhodoplanes serenus]|uniref:hypothetical protein n=1 Tax=Rhodoplanes serenus TaxID=200615 RepID=UPI0011B94448|nr:hypothetical protein [Rhodoplanes serenus]